MSTFQARAAATWRPAKPGETPGQCLPEALLAVAGDRGVDPRALDWHVEAVHGMEPHDEHYAYACDVAADCLISGICTAIRCTCKDRPHAIGCLFTAATEACALIGPDLSIFYPDNPDDAADIIAGHGAVPVNKERYAAWLAAFGDEPAPSTGAPYEDDRPPGCVCHWREYTDVGDTRYAPPEGCPVHTPWAFPGYSLTEETR